ncbi:MAG: tail fiber domain-containing protein [Nitrososphaeria archaeon]|jgi:hypothetical protein
MPFVNGQWMPQQMQAPQAAQQFQQPTAPQPQIQPQAMNQMAMMQARPQFQNQLGMQQSNPQSQLYRPQQQFQPQSQLYRPQQQMPSNMMQLGQNNPFGKQAGPPPMQGGYGPPQQSNYMPAQQGWGGPNFGVAQGQQQQVGQSVEQSVQPNSPQSVQNFMSALNKVGAGTNNQFMNGAGQQGAGAQGGFAGFGQNGYQGMMGTGVAAGSPTGGGFYGGGYQGSYGGGNGSMGRAANQAASGMTFLGDQGGGPGNNTFNTPSLTNGAYVNASSNAPNQNNNPSMGTQAGYQQPTPWAQPGNQAPGVSGSWYPDTDTGWQAYGGQLFGASPMAPSQSGSYYSQNSPSDYSMSAGSAANYATSDIRAKTNILPGKEELQEFLDALGIYSYEYKNKNDGDGRRISPMAQEIESTPLGKVAVSQRPDGIKYVDYGKLAGTQLAAIAMLNQKSKELEAKITTILSNKFNSRVINEHGKK